MKIAVVFGTRPEAIKLAPVIKQLKEKFETVVINSGQHHNLVQQIVDFFHIDVDYDLRAYVTKDRTLPQLSSMLIENLDRVYSEVSPDFIIVQGDTMTTFTAAFVGFLHKKPVAHVEAGLRSFSKFAPFPEELMREMVGRLADLHFPPTKIDKKNLLRENIRPDRIFLVGNTVVDALKLGSSILDENQVFQELGEYGITSDILKNKRLILVTSHRRENIGEPLVRICQSIKHLAQKYPDFIFVWSMHPNPEVKKIVSNHMQIRPDNIYITKPVSYPTMIYLLNNAFLVLTDSGGLQEESASLGVPVLVLRTVTERSVVIDAGAGFLVDSDRDKIEYYFNRLVQDKEFYNEVSNKGKHLFGDGTAASRIRKLLEKNELQQFIKDYPLTEKMNLERIKEGIEII
ncbi:UDP-N-acetylglucosamine 2-epimerase (non-hydrolyzing) [Persephonella sp.]|uniref:non-hydrolyzing UDP-N-acetylglucosamine 2-epimerase n=1 Tax=Persephonella sp. TaxID=2060922 RepID=UPI002633973C|nr:UDP-N-acetylglucosamine 2-epimerase (non-hydrolyzing) [Persephonella sp.]